MSSVLPSEILSRFILYHRFIRENNTVKSEAFMPYKGGTSVFRTSNMSDDIEKWQTGEREVALPQNKPLLGRADIAAVLITKNGLNVIPQEPPKWHANIIDWPEEKSKQKEIAMELATKAKLHKKL